MKPRDAQAPSAIVTGAARGIGAAIATRLAHDGYAIGVIDLDEADCAATVDAITADGGSALAVAADVAHEAAVTHAVERVAAKLSPPTVLVNNAGFARPADLVDMTTEEWAQSSASIFAARSSPPAPPLGTCSQRAGDASSTSRASRRSATPAARVVAARVWPLSSFEKTGLARGLGDGK